MLGELFATNIRLFSKAEKIDFHLSEHLGIEITVEIKT